MIGNGWQGLLTGAALLILAALFPFVANDNWLATGVDVAMYTALATSWALFSGPTHYISLASGAFFGVGGYLVATGMSDYEQSFWLMTAIAPFVAAVLAALIGLATLRLSGVYFVIFTLGLAEMVRNLVSWVQNNYLGSRGLYVLTDFTDIHIYWMLLVVCAVVYLFGWWLGRSRLGFAMRIIGNDEAVAKHVGINTALAKVVLFTTTGFFGALVGAIIAPRYSYIEPNLVFSPQLSFMVVIMALLGGTKRLWGPLIGVIAFTLISEEINSRSQLSNYSTLLMGVTFLLIVYVIPNGFTGWVEKGLKWARSRGLS